MRKTLTLLFAISLTLPAFAQDRKLSEFERNCFSYVAKLSEWNEKASIEALGKFKGDFVERFQERTAEFIRAKQKLENENGSYIGMELIRSVSSANRVVERLCFAVKFENRIITMTMDGYTLDGKPYFDSFGILNELELLYEKPSKEAEIDLIAEKVAENFANLYHSGDKDGAKKYLMDKNGMSDARAEFILSNLLTQRNKFERPGKYMGKPIKYNELNGGGLTRKYSYLMPLGQFSVALEIELIDPRRAGEWKFQDLRITNVINKSFDPLTP